MSSDQLQSNCGDCRFFSREIHTRFEESQTLPIENGFGVCRRNPPVKHSSSPPGCGHFDGSSVFESGWPVVFQKDWCGEWQEKPDEQPQHGHDKATIVGKSSRKMLAVTEWAVVKIGRCLATDESEITFRNSTYRDHIRSNVGVAKWIIGRMRKEHDIDLCKKEVPVLILGDVRDSAASTIESLRELGVFVVFQDSDETPCTRWHRLAAAFGMNPESPNSQIADAWKLFVSGEISQESYAAHAKCLTLWAAENNWCGEPIGSGPSIAAASFSQVSFGSAGSAEKPVEQSSKPPLPTECIYVMPGKQLNFDESVVKFRGRSFSSHIRSTAGVARWACDLLLKEFGIRLQEGKIPIVVDATGVGGGVAEWFRGELGATVIEYFASETAISKWRRLASATGMQIRGPAYHAAYLKSTISDPDLLEKHLAWIDEWIDWVSGEGSFHRTR